jgi:hypothetical protein
MKPVKSSGAPSVISTSNQPPKRPALNRTGKTDKLPRLSTRQIKRESDEDKHGDAEAARKVAKLKKLGFE